MKATEAKLLEFLKKSPQFVIPIYQRTYSWTEKECRQLWDDIVRTGADERIPVHFVGSIVYIDKADATISTWEPLLVIDGQQRLTTVTLLIAALAEVVGEKEPMDGFSAEILRGYYLLNTLEKGERKFKLLLSQTDKTTLTAIIANQELPANYSLRVSQNFEFFKGWIASCENDLLAVCKGLAKLMMVDIKLKRGEDNPQLIFESMNSTGKELSQADLIRNYILMGLEPDLQTRLYEDYWRPMELDFGQEAYGTQFDSFMRHYLTVRTGDIPRERDVYEAFKDYSHTKAVQEAGIEALVKEIRAFARYFCALALGRERDATLKYAFLDLRELKVDVAYPFLLELYHDYANGVLDVADFGTAVRLVEAYVFRRAICTIPTNSMNKTFSNFGRVLKKDRYLESIQAHFLLLPSYRRFPSDDEFLRNLYTRDLYNFRSRSYWLRRLENHDRKERVPVDEYTIEHILPQNPNLSKEWKDDLGPEWERIQKQWLHTLGNLTLTGYNPEYSDHPFAVKRDMKGGFKHSPLIVNDSLGQLETWNEAAIQKRAEQLAKLMLNVWAAPKLDAATLAAYQPKEPTGGTYTIADHPYLAVGSDMYGDGVRVLFDAFRKEVLALDPCVTEEFLKLYVAYKAETNFVDVIPQAKRLILSLNIPFAEINDPRQLCKDVTNMGHWGNGDTEVYLQSPNDHSYILGLVRQAFECQMGDGGQP